MVALFVYMYTVQSWCVIFIIPHWCILPHARIEIDRIKFYFYLLHELDILLLVIYVFKENPFNLDLYICMNTFQLCSRILVKAKLPYFDM